jgi:hypothetical protein
VKYLGQLASCEQCRDACEANSTTAVPCRSWAFYFSDSAHKTYAGSCFGRHDDVWHPTRDLPIDRNHCCSAVSCKHPPPPAPPPPPLPPPPLPGPPPPPDGPATPVFSWNTVPVYSFPCFDPSRGPDADIALLARFPLVLLCHGYYVRGGALVKAEPAMAAVARQI